MFKFMLTILGAVAEMERELTVERIREGMAKAKKYGAKSGRPSGRLLSLTNLPLKTALLTHLHIRRFRKNLLWCPRLLRYICPDRDAGRL